VVKLRFIKNLAASSIKGPAQTTRFSNMASSRFNNAMKKSKSNMDPVALFRSKHPL